jgi:hypothetical protein
MHWFWVRVDPFNSELDASAFSSAIRDNLVPDPRATQPLAENRIIENLGIPGYANARVFEVGSDDRNGSGVAWVFAGHVDRIVLTAQCSFYNDSWSWVDAISIVSTQVEKVLTRVSAGYRMRE